MPKTVTRLFKQFQPEAYDLTLAPDGNAMTFTGSVTIMGKKVGRPSERITLHQKGLKVSSATITRHDKKGDQSFTVERINLQKSYDEIRLHTSEMLFPGAYTITLEFSGAIHEVMHGIYPCNYIVDGVKKKLIATQFESHHAREAFPCIDEPEAKATFDLALISPAGEHALSNMPAKVQTITGETQTTIFQTTPKMSTYLLAFVYGELHCKEGTTKDGVVVRTWATKNHPIESLDFALDVGVRAIEFFDEYYGVPYPLAKADHVALPDFSAGAMENWGLITYRESCLIVDPATTSQSMKERVATVVTHELSHQWFGNLVTMTWWDDLWLNESFANVMEYVATDALFPDWQIWNSFVGSEGLSAQRRDSLPGVQSVHTAVNHPDEIGSLFDPSIVYAKGGRLLNMLMNYLGSDIFRQGLKLYFDKHAYGNTVGNDLWEALSAASGKDVASFMTPWLTRSGFPLITIDQAGPQLRITQQHFLVDPAQADDRSWSVPLLSDDAQVPELLEAKSVVLDLKNPVYIRINHGAVGHYIVRYAEAEHASAIASLAETKVLTPAERLMLLSDSSLIARSGIASFGETLALLQHYAQEDTESGWDIISLTVADARRFIDLDESLEDQIKAFIRQFIQVQYDRLGWDEIAGESSEDGKLRATIIGLGVYSQHEEILGKALADFETYKTSDTPIAGEIRGIVFGAAVRNQVAGAFDYLLKLEESTSNPDLKQESMGALTLTKSPEHATLLLGRIQDLTKVRLHEVDTWLIYLLRNRYVRELAWDWLRDNWAWIEKTFEGDKSYDAFPRYAASTFNTPTLLAEYKAFFNPKLSNVALNRNITLGIQELASRIPWLERDLAAVQSFFS